MNHRDNFGQEAKIKCEPYTETLNAKVKHKTKLKSFIPQEVNFMKKKV